MNNLRLFSLFLQCRQSLAADILRKQLCCVRVVNLDNSPCNRTEARVALPDDSRIQAACAARMVGCIVGCEPTFHSYYIGKSRAFDTECRAARTSFVSMTETIT